MASKSYIHLLSTLCGVEIPVFIFFLTASLCGPAQQTFIYQRMCLNIFDSSQVLCENIDTYSELSAYEVQLQQQFSYYSTVMMLFSNIPSAVMALFMGTICDKISFRWPLAIPHIGSALASSIYLLYSYLPPKETSPFQLTLPSLITGLSGNVAATTVAGLAYISNVSSEKQRTFRIAGLEAVITVGSAVGYSLSSALLNSGGPTLVFLVQIAANMYSLTYIFSTLPEIQSSAEVRRRIRIEAAGSWTTYVFSQGPLSVWRKELKSNPQYKITRPVWMIIFAKLLNAGVAFGIGSVLYEFLTSSPIALSASLYALEQGLFCGLMGINLLLTIRLLRLNSPPMFPLSDSTLPMIGAISRIAGLLVLSFGDFMPQVVPWLYCVVYMFAAFFTSCFRSIVSRLVSEKIRGAVFGISALAETLMSVAMGTVFNIFYASTLNIVDENGHFNPMAHGSVFLVGTIMQVPACLITIWFTLNEQWINEQYSIIDESQLTELDTQP